MPAGNYSGSDKLAIALACLTAIMAIVLFIIGKTPLTVICLLVLMVGFAVYPTLHFAKSRLARILVLVIVIASAVLLGWTNWPHASVDAYSGQKSSQEHQANQGSNNTNNSTTVQGNNNNVVTGNGNTVKSTTVIQKTDPRSKALADQVEKLLKERQQSTAESFSPGTLLKKYPLGYSIFAMNYSQQVFPYHTEARQFDIEWDTASLTDTGDAVMFSIPTIFTIAGHHVAIYSNTLTITKRGIGQPYSPFTFNGVSVVFELLGTDKDGIVLLMGFVG